MKYKKINPILLTAIALIILASTACNKIKDQIDPTNNSVDELFTLLKSSPQSFSVQAGTNWTIIGAKGTRIHFNPQSFKDANGNLISSGTIDIELIETPKATDMLLNKTITMSGSNGMLQSGGSINIQASQNGQTLQAGRYGIDFIQTSSSTDDMSIFQGTTDNNTGFTSWLDIATNTQQGTRQDSVGFFFGFDSVNNFNWINCDRFYNDPRPKTNVTITAEGETLTLNGMVTFMLFPEINAVTNMFPVSLTDFNKMDLGDYYKAPEGIKAHFVTLAKKGDNYYYGELKNQTISNNHSAQVTIRKATAAEIKAAIQNL